MEEIQCYSACSVELLHIHLKFCLDHVLDSICIEIFMCKCTLFTGPKRNGVVSKFANEEGKKLISMNKGHTSKKL